MLEREERKGNGESYPISGAACCTRCDIPGRTRDIRRHYYGTVRHPSRAAVLKPPETIRTWFPWRNVCVRLSIRSSMIDYLQTRACVCVSEWERGWGWFAVREMVSSIFAILSFSFSAFFPLVGDTRFPFILIWWSRSFVSKVNARKWDVHPTLLPFLARLFDLMSAWLPSVSRCSTHPPIFPFIHFPTRTVSNGTSIFAILPINIIECGFRDYVSPCTCRAAFARLSHDVRVERSHRGHTMIKKI